MLPDNGTGLGAVILVGVVFLVTGLGYGFAVSRLRHGPARPDEHLLAGSEPAVTGERPSTELPAASPAGPSDPARST
jgi:hypothetical protein